MDRNQQLPRLRDIYSLASRVLIWVGLEADNSSFALDVLQKLSTQVKVTWNPAAMTPSRKAIERGVTHWADTAQYLPYTAKELVPLYHLLDRPYFERLWVQQEIRLANADAILICGRKVLLWSSFSTSIHAICRKQRRADLHLGFDQAAHFSAKLNLVYLLCRNHPHVTLLDLMRETKTCECSDDRDRVYALLGILNENEAESLNIAPDYN